MYIRSSFQVRLVASPSTRASGAAVESDGLLSYSSILWCLTMDDHRIDSADLLYVQTTEESLLLVTSHLYMGNRIACPWLDTQALQRGKLDPLKHSEFSVTFNLYHV